MNKKPIFIGFSGKKQVGKTTATQMITEKLCRNGFCIAEYAFADPLKQICIDLLGLAREDVYGDEEAKNKPTHILWRNLPGEIRQIYSQIIPAYRGYDLYALRDGYLLREGPMTVREVLQVLGTDIFRRIYPSIWAEAPFKKTWLETDFVIVSDVRFPNEKEAIENHGGIVIRILRETNIRDEHESEKALDGVLFSDYYMNSGTLDDLRNFVDTFLKCRKLI